MMRHGPVPPLGPGAPLGPPFHHPMEPLPHPELLESKLVSQGAEMDRLLVENKRLAATHGTLRQELVAAQQEMQRIHSHSGRVQTENDIQLRNFQDKILKLETDVKSGEIIRKELQQAHLEAQSLVAARQELTVQILQDTEDLKKLHSDLKKLPEMHAELDGLMQEHQKLRATFEHEKGANMELVQQMHVMEKNLITMAREVEKLRAEVQNAEKKANAPNPYQSQYGTPDPVNPSPAQGTNQHAGGSYSQGGGYGGSSYNHYGHSAYAQGMSANYDPYGRGQTQAAAGGSAAVGEGTNPYMGAASAGAYDPNRAAGPGGYDAARAAYDASRGALAAAGGYDAGRGVAGGGGYDASRGSAGYDAARGMIPGGYDAGRGAAPTGGYDASRAAAASGGYDHVRMASAGGGYDARSTAAGGGYDAARMAAGGVASAYDGSRPGENMAGMYDGMRAPAGAYGMYDPTRAAQQQSGPR